MGFIDCLKEHSMSFEYFGANDIATAMEIKDIVEQPNYYNELMQKYPLKYVNSLEDYCIYMIYSKFAKYKEMCPMLAKKEYVDIINDFSCLAENQIKQIKVGTVICFINNHIKDICEAEIEIIGLRTVTFDFIEKYKSGIKEEVYKYLSSNYDYVLLDRFQEFEVIFEKYTYLFDEIFKTGHYSEIVSLREETVFNIFASVGNKQNSKLKETVYRVLPILSNDILDMCESATIENVMLVERTVDRFCNCLRRLKSPLGNQFIEPRKKINKLLNESVKANGFVLNYEIPTGEIIEKLSKEKFWEKRMISLTHDSHIDENNNLLITSRLENVKSGKKNILDYISSNRNTNDYYTQSLQQNLSVMEAVEAGTFQTILFNNKTYEDYMNMLMSVICFISEKMDCEEDNLEFDIRILDANLKICVGTVGEYNEVDIALCYGASMFICGLIDKLLRLLYLNIAAIDEYVDMDKISMGQILRGNNTKIVDYFGKNHVKHLAFFLNTDEEIGRKTRNNLAHWKVNPESINIGTVAELLWLFTDIVNTIFAHYLVEKLD
ncbi:MAG: hypothetical protein E7273_13905 [Pseudobutyrivibrio ruminis]|nr:hypothetical protein [Pseudobutyrivibrio ruminis]